MEGAEPSAEEAVAALASFANTAAALPPPPAEGKRVRKPVQRHGLVPLLDTGLYEDVSGDEEEYGGGATDYGGGGAAFDSDSDGAPRRGRRAQGGNTAAQRAKRVKKEEMVNAMEADVARGVGFDPYTLSEEEQAALPDGVDEDKYCLIRNHVLAKWRADVTRLLSEESARSRIVESQRGLVSLAHQFLHKHGYINFGLVAQPPRGGPSAAKGTVLILGAGLAGLAAARQLLAQGHKVAVVEARRRPGGRVHSVRLAGAADGAREGPPECSGVGELGGSVITGADGNPLAVIARQLGATLHSIRNSCPLYALDGSPVPADMDEKVFRQFNTLLDSCAEFRTNIGAAADIVSLGRAMEQLSYEHGVGTTSAAERALLDWHMANLEYANAADLATLSLGQWDQDDPWEMQGEHCLLPGGNVRLIAALADNVPIFYGCRVTRVEHSGAGVTLRCVEGEAWPGDDSGGADVASCSHAAGGDAAAPAAVRERVFRADAALITLPLGVLKAGDVEFAPQLPARKREAVHALGFGTLNKCVLLFPVPFWDDSTDTFGRVAASTEARGEYFLFYSYAGLGGPNGATLIGLVAGEAAVPFEADAAEACLERCLATLRSIFAPKGVEVPTPSAWRCSRWTGDPFARGSYSHVAVGSSGDDYDAIMEPVFGRLFFAGEATTRKHPATMHGAFFSGLREAARITDAVRRRGAKRGGGGGGADGGRGSGLSGAAASAAALAAARDAAHLQRQLSAAFASPDWEFGAFSLALLPGDASHDAPALLRLEIPPGGGNKRPLPLYLRLSLGDALALRDCAGGDAERLRLLLALPGGSLFGRRALPHDAAELAADLALLAGVPRQRPLEPDELAPPAPDAAVGAPPAPDAAAHPFAHAAAPAPAAPPPHPHAPPPAPPPEVAVLMDDISACL